MLKKEKETLPACSGNHRFLNRLSIPAYRDGAAGLTVSHHAEAIEKAGHEAAMQRITQRKQRGRGRDGNSL